MKNVKRPLKVVLAELTTELVDAILSAARAALANHDVSIMLDGPVERRASPPPRRPAPPTPAPRPKAAPPKAPAPKSVRPEPVRKPAGKEFSAREAATDQLITDPMALLAALETADTGTRSGTLVVEVPPVRELPALLASVDDDDGNDDDDDGEEDEADEEKPEEAVTHVRERETVPSFRAREGEQVLRTTGSHVVLRRRRA